MSTQKFISVSTRTYVNIRMYTPAQYDRYKSAEKKNKPYDDNKKR